MRTKLGSQVSKVTKYMSVRARGERGDLGSHHTTREGW